MLRLARELGFESYEAFRHAFQEALRSGPDSFAERAEWLQRVGSGGDAGPVLAEMAKAQLSNVESAFRQLDPAAINAAAEALLGARCAYILGVAGLNGLAGYFHFVGRMALANLQFVQAAGGSVIDELLRIGKGDLLLVVSVEPYGAETLRAAEFAKRQGAEILAVTDSRAAPVAALAGHLLLAPTGSPQFFPSMTAALAILESLLALVVSKGDQATVKEIARIDRLREAEGIYWQAPRRR
jgi:DNA-binding MurR/RpiR family transcriptional regulator